MSGSQLKVLSSEAYSKHGYKPSCVIFDELHAQPNRDLWDVMTFGAGAARRQPVWIVLTTAGDDPDRKSIGWEVHEKALGIWRYRRGDRDERAQDDPRWLPIIYGLGLVEDEDKLKELKKKAEITEDDQKGLEKKLQELTDKYCKEIDELSAKKDKEIMEI